jgi:hypothetical protein
MSRELQCSAVESPLSAPPVAEPAELDEELLEATKFDVHAWFEAYLQEPAEADYPGVPFH